MRKDSLKYKIDSFGIMNSSWIKNQVDGHLFVGLIYRYIPTFILGGLLIGLSYLWKAFSTEKIVSSQIAANLIEGGIITLAMIYGSFYLSKYHQAVISWITIKVSFGLLAFILMTVGTCISLSRHQSDALPNFLMGFVWLPCIEFIPTVVPHQKIVTIARLLLTVPLVYLGIQSGYWSWN